MSYIQFINVTPQFWDITERSKIFAFSEKGINIENVLNKNF